LHKPIQTNENNVNNVRHETNRTFRNKRREYLKEKKLMSWKASVGTKISETDREE
jgi:hypothetical protein